MNNGTARETLLLSVWGREGGKKTEKKQGFTSYSADNADDDYYHRLVCCCAALRDSRCVCKHGCASVLLLKSATESFRVFVKSARHNGDDNLSRLLPHLRCTLLTPPPR